MPEDKFSVLSRYFGHSSFREGQAELIDRLAEGGDVLGVMPTGAGKSVCYQIPAMLRDGVALVISPLISLMKDQVASLTQAGIPAAFINSSLSQGSYAGVCRRVQEGEFKILYIAPERLEAVGFQRIVQSCKLSLIAVDEAHCVSQWGQDFRPSYLKIAKFISELPARPPVGAFTATATAAVRKDIVSLLGLDSPLSIINSFNRPNLFFQVEQPGDKLEYLKSFIASRGDSSGIVYCSTRSTVDQVCGALRDGGVSATRYHAGLTDDERRRNQDEFVCDNAQVMVATNAFGMGIDKSNVSYVAHFNMPKDIESYYQEAGRAGRDGSEAHCLLLFSPKDISTAKYLICNSRENSELDEAEQKSALKRDFERLNGMIGYCKTTGCLRHYILRYFGEQTLDHCESCGSCLSDYVENDITVESQKILSAVTRINNKCGCYFGANMVIDLLKGSKARRLLDLGLDRLPTYGIMQELDRRRIACCIDRLVALGYLEQTLGEYPLLRLTARSQSVLRGGCTVTMRERREQSEETKQSIDKLSKLFSGGVFASQPEDESLFAKLKALRMKLAQAAGVPAFIISSDATLHDMAAKQPHTHEQLLKVSGVGATKAERYGKQFLDVINEHCDAVQDDQN